MSFNEDESLWGMICGMGLVCYLIIMPVLAVIIWSRYQTPKDLNKS